MENEFINVMLDKETGFVKGLYLKNDSENMNWCGEGKSWGEFYCGFRDNDYFKWNGLSLACFEETQDRSDCTYTSDRIEIKVHRDFAENGNYRESYTVKNITASDFFMLRGDFGIYTPFCDEYITASKSQKIKCNAHVWCGENVSYINALRQGISDMNVGLALTKGSVSCYSIDKSVKPKTGCRRGDIILHPEHCELLPQESFTVEWELFRHNGKDDFYRRLHSYPGYIHATAKEYTVFSGENIDICIDNANKFDNISASINGESIPVHKNSNQADISYKPDTLGEQRINITADGVKTHVSVFVAEPLDKLIEKRIHYIVQNQQYSRKGSMLDGAYLIYDNREKKCYFNDFLRDHNACRERLGMGILIAKYLRTHEDKPVYESFLKYTAFLKREIINVDTGEVCDSVGHNNKPVRLYNAPWAITFLAELYMLSGDAENLDIMEKALDFYYGQGGKGFYPNGYSLKLITDAFKAGGKEEAYKKAVEYFRAHTENMISVGLNYPQMECIFEQTIVTPPVNFMCNMYLITGEKKYAELVKQHITVLDRFDGSQPDYRLNGIPVRYWDGYWFGKAAQKGDTFPHYWSALTARSWYQFYSVTGDEAYKRKAVSCMRNCLCLFKPDGTASCAYLYPFRIDSNRGEFFDDWANDQDFALYFAMLIL